MRFQLAAPDPSYESGKKSGGINGGTVWMDNLAQALRYHGHEADLVSIGHDFSADYVIVQGEFIDSPRIKDLKNRGEKIIVLLSHFNCPQYPPVAKVRELATYIFTPWEGDLLYETNAKFMPHAYGDLWDDMETENRKGSIVFAGNTYSLRNEDWFDGLDITRISGTHPQDLFPIYRGADVCVNLHGDFQKNKIAKGDFVLADKPGMMINERFWNVLGAGGLLITDWIPQMERWFDRDELIVAESKEEFQRLVNYYKDHKQEGLDKLKGARFKVRKYHTYKERVAEMLKQLC